MTKQDRVVMELCLRILLDAVERAPATKGETTAIRLALRCLLPICGDKETLVNFWSALGSHYDIGRSQGVATAYRAVVAQLEKKGIERPAAFPSCENNAVATN